MRIRNSSLLFHIFVIMLAILVQLANCREINQATTEETEQTRITAAFYFPFSRRLAATPHPTEFSTGKVGPVYIVSHQLVPGGPNPLHN
ncbi:hypothetical protein ACSBR2_008272 [Camellia fascicularis]